MTPNASWCHVINIWKQNAKCWDAEGGFSAEISAFTFREMCEDCLLSFCQRCELVNRSAQPQRSPTFLRFSPSSEAVTAPDPHVRSRTASSYLLSLWRCRDRLLVLSWAQACVCAHLALQKMRLSDDVWIGKNVPSRQHTGRLKWDSIWGARKAGRSWHAAGSILLL